MIDEEGNIAVEGELVAYRGLFLIDLDGKVRHQVVNDMPLGRSIAECLRTIDALQHFEEHGEVCPMDWQKGGSNDRRPSGCFRLPWKQVILILSQIRPIPRDEAGFFWHHPLGIGFYFLTLNPGILGIQLISID